MIVALLSLAGSPLAALTVKPMTFTELVTQSVAIVHGRVVDVRGQWTADRRAIDSVITVEAIAYLKGQLGDRVSVRVPGGEAGGYVNVIPGAPRFSTGDEVVLFLTGSGPSIPVVTGTTQGVFRVSRDARSGGVVVTPPVIETPASAQRLVRGEPTRRPLPLPAFAAAVQTAQEAH
ncbi:MAG: hypothetical protein IT178_15275 [Acidobacteria bacterium]|nr:hypothetical protein [Acidobacteriota bacterium]